MEFDELQKIWDSQNQQPLYVINESALHHRIQAKKKRAMRITNFSELFLIGVYIGAGCLVAGLNVSKSGGNLFMYLLAGWMLITAIVLLVSRIRRIQAEHTFDRSLLGELNHAVATSTYQVRLSQLMRWNNLPIGILILVGMWEGGKSIWIAAALLLFFILAHVAGGWEHRFYIARKLGLESLQKKLQQD